jgi:hypothetical protein
VVDAMLATHPCEEPADDVIPLTSLRFAGNDHDRLHGLTG